MCLTQDCPNFDKLRVLKTVVQEAFNLDDIPTAEDLRQCTPFTANVTVTGVHITNCDILTVPDNLFLSTVDDIEDSTVDNLLSSNLADHAVCENALDVSSDMSHLKQDSTSDLGISERNLLYPEEK